MTPVTFMLLPQFIIFLLGWPLEWTEIIIIFVPIFLPLLKHYDIDPVFFGVMVALNIQTSFLTPPMAMSCYYLKGVAPPHVTLNQIFAGAFPFLILVFITMFLRLRVSADRHVAAELHLQQLAATLDGCASVHGYGMTS